MFGFERSRGYAYLLGEARQLKLPREVVARCALAQQLPGLKAERRAATGLLVLAPPRQWASGPL